MDAGKEDTSKHVHRVEKLFTDMYMLPPTKEAKRKRSQAIINIESNLTAFHKNFRKYNTAMFYQKTGK